MVARLATPGVGGRIIWEGERDSEGHRTWTLVSRVEVTDPGNDGPYTALKCPGLPLPGSQWFFGNDLDLWAFCTARAKIKQVDGEGDPTTAFDVEQEFSTKPPERSKCQDQEVEDPLLEPPQVSGSFVKDRKEATHDRFGRPILTSSHEVIRGPQVEFDENRWQVKIVMNVAVLDLPTIAEMKDSVSDATLWGVPRRCVKLSDFSWEKKYYGFCEVYYVLSFTFEIHVAYNPVTGSYSSGFDRYLLDEGNKALNGRWSTTTGKWVLVDVDNVGTPPDLDNPAHFCRFTDRQGNQCRVILNGAGVPSEATVGTGTGTSGQTGGAGYRYVEKYAESNFLLLGIPTSL
jgi:hypothetical protein